MPACSSPATPATPTPPPTSSPTSRCHYRQRLAQTRPTYLDGNYTCAKIAQKSNHWKLSNYQRYCNKEYDAVIAELKKTTDEAKRKELIVKVNESWSTMW